jgi:hypothetical protein
MAASLHGDELAPMTLCRLFKQHYSKDINQNDLDPDLRGAAYIVAVARPDNCDLDEGATATKASSKFGCLVMGSHMTQDRITVYRTRFEHSSV